MLLLCARLKPSPPLGVCQTFVHWDWWGSPVSNGTSRMCSAGFLSLERLVPAPLRIYLYAWPGIFPEQWLNTRWRRPRRPPPLRSRHGQCRAAPERWDLRRDTQRETKREDDGIGWRGEGVRAEEQRWAGNTKQSKEEAEDYSQLVPDLMIVLSCCHSPLAIHIMPPELNCLALGE